MVSAALSGELEGCRYELDPVFNINVPLTCKNVPDEVLNPRLMWKDKDAYDQKARMLAERFAKNFEKYNNMPENIIKMLREALIDCDMAASNDPIGNGSQ